MSAVLNRSDHKNDRVLQDPNIQSSTPNCTAQNSLSEKPCFCLKAGEGGYGRRGRRMREIERIQNAKKNSVRDRNGDRVASTQWTIDGRISGRRRRVFQWKGRDWHWDFRFWSDESATIDKAEKFPKFCCLLLKGEEEEEKREKKKREKKKGRLPGANWCADDRGAIGEDATSAIWIDDVRRSFRGECPFYLQTNINSFPHSHIHSTKQKTYIFVRRLIRSQ